MVTPPELRAHPAIQGLDSSRIGVLESRRRSGSDWYDMPTGCPFAIKDASVVTAPTLLRSSLSIPRRTLLSPRQTMIGELRAGRLLVDTRTRHAWRVAAERVGPKPSRTLACANSTRSMA